MFKDTFNGTTFYCEACEYQGWHGKEEADKLNLKHTCGKEAVPSWVEAFEQKFSNQPDYYKKEFIDYFRQTIKTEREEAVKETFEEVDKATHCQKLIKGDDIHGDAICGVKLDCHLHDWRQKDLIKTERELAVKEFKNSEEGAVYEDYRTLKKQAVREVIEEIEKGLPVKGITDLYLSRKFYPEEFVNKNQAGGYNVCLKDVKELINKLKAKYETKQ